MCCIRINTGTFMALLTNAVIKDGRKKGYSFRLLEEYIEYMESAIPTYVATDFGLDAVNYMVSEYGNIFKKRIYNENDKYGFRIVLSKYNPNMDYFLNGYNAHLYSYLIRMTNSWWKRKVNSLKDMESDVE